MPDEANTLPSGGTDNVNLSTSDTPDALTYWDPDDDQDTPESDVEESTDDEADETATEDEASGQEAEVDDEQQDAPDEPVAETATVKMADGTTVTVAELLKGHLRQSDYTRKVQELANARNTTQAEAQRIANITDAFTDHLLKLIPAEPDTALALRDPGKYTAQKAQYEAALAQVQKLIQIGDQAKDSVKGMTGEAQKAHIAEQNRALGELFPETTTKAGRDKFFGKTLEAAEAVGFSVDDLNAVTDHRVFALAHWAKKGMDAEKAKTAAKAKVASAPPVAPRKPGQAAAGANRNAEAMRKLSRSGSIHDAVKLDWD